MVWLDTSWVLPAIDVDHDDAELLHKLEIKPHPKFSDEAWVCNQQRTLRKQPPVEAGGRLVRVLSLTVRIGYHLSPPEFKPSAVSQLIEDGHRV